MSEETLKLMNKIIAVLTEKQYILKIPNFYFERINIKNFLEYLRYYVLNDFTQDELDILKSKVFVVKDKYNECGVATRNYIVTRVILPDIDNIISALITVHELNHYITYKNKLKEFTYMSLYDELIPMNSEFSYLEEFYKDYLKEYENYRFNEAVKCAYDLANKSESNKIQDIDKNNNFSEIINQLSHIYSLLILMQNNNYKENSVIFNEINKTPNPLEYEFSERGIYLRKSIIKELKNIN